MWSREFSPHERQNIYKNAFFIKSKLLNVFLILISKLEWNMESSIAISVPYPSDSGLE